MTGTKNKSSRHTLWQTKNRNSLYLEKRMGALFERCKKHGGTYKRSKAS